MWKYRLISSNSTAQLEIKDTINEVTYGCLALITCGSIHEGHEWFSDDSRRRQEIFVFGCSIISAILPIRERRFQDIDQVLLHKIIFFLSVYSAAVRC